MLTAATARSAPPLPLHADREDELLVAQRKINQLKAAGNSGGLAGGAAAAGEQAARGGGGSPVAGAPAAASADAADTARLHQLLQVGWGEWAHGKRTCLCFLTCTVQSPQLAVRQYHISSCP